MLTFFSIQTNNRFWFVYAIILVEWIILDLLYQLNTNNKRKEKVWGRISIQLVTTRGDVWVGGERSAYHSPLLIKTNDSRCCTAPGRGTVGRRVCVGGSPSLLPPSILLRSPPQYRLGSRHTMCNARKKGWSKCKWYGVMHYTGCEEQWYGQQEGVPFF